jgi:biopolymer transport protein ExbD
MAVGPEKSNGIIDTINVTPLVDITLVLLIIFIVTAKIIAAPAVPVDLPRAAKTREVQVVFSVVLPATGPTLVDGKNAVDDAALLRFARRAVVRDPEVRAVINADGAVPHRRVIHTLGLLKEAGIARVAFGAIPEERVK